MMAYPGSIPSILILLKLLGLFYQKTLPLSNSPAGTACVRTMIRRIIEKPAPPGPGADEGAVPRNVRLSKYPAEPRTWCLTALQPLFLRRQAQRPPLQSAGHPRGRGASLSSSPYFFVEEHHVRRSKVPGSPEAWCLTALQPLFLRPQAPRQAAQALGRLRMRPDIAKSRFFSINVY